MNIYTKTGDTGETGLFGGQRVHKHHQRVEAYGTVDELNAVLGVVVAECDIEEITDALIDIQSSLFDLGADLATPFNSKHEAKIQRFPDDRAKLLEDWIDRADAQLPQLRNFILPGGNIVGARLHLARTVCRRAERQVTALGQLEAVNTAILSYLNRLSDCLFVMARFANHVTGQPENIWQG